ncbi:MAG: hypothetical protein JXQ67_10100 [Campylobacterales bacterium]|nr:hypothetical protein [Campylobacterales bacterium]
MKYPIILLIFFLFGCSSKHYEITQTKIITLKTKEFKYSDLGYIRSSANDVELELFSAGKSLFKVEIGNFICTSQGCVRKKIFNEKYFTSHYPDDLLQNVILGKPILNAKNIKYLNDGFSQKIETENVNIDYIVGNRGIFFKDKKNAILIKIRDN